MQSTHHSCRPPPSHPRCQSFNEAALQLRGSCYLVLDIKTCLGYLYQQRLLSPLHSRRITREVSHVVACIAHGRGPPSHHPHTLEAERQTTSVPAGSGAAREPP